MKDDRLISLNAAKDYIDSQKGRPFIGCTIGEAMKIMLDEVPPAQPDVPDTNVGDMISRQAAIKTAHLPVIDDAGYEVVRVNDILALPSAQPGWILVTERLPKPNEEDGNGFYKAYLVQDGRWMDVARWDGKYWVAWGYSTVLLNVVAWMPLPKPWENE